MVHFISGSSGGNNVSDCKLSTSDSDTVQTTKSFFRNCFPNELWIITSNYLDLYSVRQLKMVFKDPSVYEPLDKILVSLVKRSALCVENLGNKEAIAATNPEPQEMVDFLAAHPEYRAIPPLPSWVYYEYMVEGKLQRNLRQTSAAAIRELAFLKDPTCPIMDMWSAIDDQIKLPQKSGVRWLVTTRAVLFKELTYREQLTAFSHWKEAFPDERGDFTVTKVHEAFFDMVWSWFASPGHEHYDLETTLSELYINCEEIIEPYSLIVGGARIAGAPTYSEGGAGRGYGVVPHADRGLGVIKKF
jgi:hypothetical protein